MTRPSTGAVLLLTACAYAGSSPAADAQAVGEAVGGVRYEHVLERSRFDPGPGARRVVSGETERVAGPRGVFMIDRATGASIAVPNAPLAEPKPPARDRVAAQPIPFPQPLSEDPEQHTAAVQEYLLNAGVPRAEVSGTHVMATMAGGGPVKDGVQPGRSHLLWYTTQLERSVGGVPVQGSFAYAALDREQRAISEGVYWPQIPAQVAARALVMKERLASPQVRAEFVAKARQAESGIGDAEGRVVIKHTSAFFHGPFQAEAVYVVAVGTAFGGKVRMVAFDESSSPVRMADDAPSGQDSPKRR